MQKILLRIWLYGVPIAGFALCMTIYAFGLPSGSPLRYAAVLILLALLIFVISRANQIERSLEFKALPSRLQLIFAGFLLGFIVLIVAFAARWDIHKMAGISAPIMSLSAIPIALVDRRKRRRGDA